MFGLITHLVLNYYSMFHNCSYHFKCFILVINPCFMFQNGLYPLKCFILALNLRSIFQNAAVNCLMEKGDDFYFIFKYGDIFYTNLKV